MAERTELGKERGKQRGKKERDLERRAAPHIAQQNTSIRFATFENEGNHECTSPAAYKTAEMRLLTALAAIQTS